MRGLMSIDVNPVPIKAAASAMGLCGPEFRLPLVGLDEKQNVALRSILTQFELLA
jgi:4-hydroxy-tetrahydrodipicolinate synthase